MKKIVLVIAVMLIAVICLTGCKKLTVTWKNYDGTVLEVDENIKKGTIPEYNGEKPTRPSDNDNDYAFKGWSPTISEVTKDQIYVAEFDSIPKWEDGNPDNPSDPRDPVDPDNPDVPATKATDFVFVDTGDSYFIKAYIGNDKTVVIPSTYNEKPVTALEKWA